MNILNNLQKAKNSTKDLLCLTEENRIQVLNALADKLDSHIQEIINQNELDLAKMDKIDPRYDRLKLNDSRIKAIANDVRKVAKLNSPINNVLEEKTLPNGIKLVKKSVPLGVVAVIYESRPNVTIDVFSLCFKSGNVVVLKGGSDAYHSNLILVKLIKEVLTANNISTEIIYLMPTEREAMLELLSAVGLVDVCIPRGSQNLIQFVRENAKIPVIETGAGIVHTYVDASADVDMAASIINNAKTRRVSVCNALDCLLVHKSQLLNLDKLVAKLQVQNVVIFADELIYSALEHAYPQNLLQLANENSYGCEFLDYKLAIKVVGDIDEAISHISKYTSGHSEAIISNDEAAISKFINLADAAVVYINASTAFTDGGEFGMGAEIGISTQKLHARGPMALPELTSYKWIAYGNGQIR
ncbi:MAG: glutamate-5-semialdehyde dehydrogenase [Neisseriaceae bacterium]|nr:MAG: glutamate-5-semialdehyde dehydrogenase [Neisseriaceae bacterium]